MRVSVKQINYFFLALVLLWQPLQIAFIQVDGVGRIPLFFAILVFIINYINEPGFKKQILSKPLVFWGIWVLYSTVNLLIQGYHGEIPILFFCINFLFSPFLVMLVASREIVRNKKQTLHMLCVIFVIYALLSVTVLGAQTNIDSDRNLGALWNGGPLTSLFIIFFSGLLYVSGWLNTKKLIPLILFAVVVILIGGTRKALGGAMLLVATLVIPQLKFSLKKLATVIIFSGLIYLVYTYVMEKTSMGERFKKGFEVGEDTNTTGIKLLDFVGDRTTFYINGWQVFLENKINGIGLRNYMHETKSDYVIHSEYMVQLVEGGILGSVLFLLFNIGVGKGIYSAWKKFPRKRSVIWILAGAFGVILFIGFTTWTYSFARYYIVYGVIIGYLQSFKFESGRRWLLFRKLNKKREDLHKVRHYE